MDIRVCPSCGAEYFAHVADCADCGTALMLPEELDRLDAERDGFMRESGGKIVAIKEGETSLVKELSHVLKGSGIKSFVNLAPGCSSGSCCTSSVLLVAESDAEMAAQCLHSHHLKTNPEAADLQEYSDDSCPACGHAAGPDEAECPDCGLAL